MADRSEQQRQILQEQLETWREFRNQIRTKVDEVTISNLEGLAQAMKIITNGERQALDDLHRTEDNGYLTNLSNE